MENKLFVSIIFFLSFCVYDSYGQTKYPYLFESTTQNEISNKMSNQYMPVMGVWVWGKTELLPDGYKEWIDKASMHSPYNLLIPFLRFSDKEVVDNVIHDQIKSAADYAVKKNLALVADLDIRSARRSFKNKYPEELQEMLRLKEVILLKKDSIEVVVPSLDLNDHYTGGSITHHISLSGSLLRIYSYCSTANGIEPESLKDITKQCKLVSSTKDSVIVRIPSCKTNGKGQNNACVMVSFSHLYPDIFAPHLMEYQQAIIKKYADVRLAGVCKDEWGFPPYYPRFYKQGFYDFWFSKYRAQAYSIKTGGRDLLTDCLLMAKGINGKESERQMAVNCYMEMSRERNSALENDFYNTVKDVFGPNAVVAVHSTWWPYPDRCEFNKNGLDWWSAKRDWAQTDELAPFAVRTALCKKWGSPVWYNMYYKEDLATQVWSSALAGGRINYLPFQSLFNTDILQAESRIRLLNYISKSPLDCPVAVIFGHACAMNWAGPYYEDVGMEIVDSLWHEGYYVDLIPTSEIENGSLCVNSDGSISYGCQRYKAVVLYHPEFEKKSTAEFFTMAGKGNTALFRIGYWTKDFYGTSIDSDDLFPKSMIDLSDSKNAFMEITELLKERDVPVQTPATGVLDNSYFKLRDFNHTSCSPPTTGFCRLIDGTVIQIAGTNNIGGDTIKSDFMVYGNNVSINAIGVAAVRLDQEGKLQALAAGGLKYLKAGKYEINLDKRVDLALWIDSKGELQGIIQSDNEAIIPKELLKITSNWNFLNLPVLPKK